MRGFLYDALVLFLRVVTRVFFRSVEVSGAELVPLTGPVIFVGNHPNSLLDPVMMTTACERRVRFAAKETLFRSPFLKPFLWVLGAVPIRRRQDQVAGAAEDAPTSGLPANVNNDDAFRALFDVLARGEAFGIFPEGISHTRPELAPLKTGAARIALGASEHMGQDVRIVPVGLSYRRRDRMRSRVLVQFGSPLVVDAAWRARHQQDSIGAARALTADIDRALRAQTINAADFDTLRVLDAVRRLYKPAHVELSLSEHTELMRRFLSAWDKLREDDEVRAFYRDVETYLLTLRMLGLSDRDLTDGVDFLGRAWRTVRLLAFFFVLVPFAIPGTLIHAPVLVTAVLAGASLTSRGDVRATIKMCAATVLTLLAYAVIAVIVFIKVPFPYDVVSAAAVLLGLLTSGWATIRVLERQAETRRHVRASLALFSWDAEIRRLSAQRDTLRSRLLLLVEKHKDAALPHVIDPAEQKDAQPWLADDDVD